VPSVVVTVDRLGFNVGVPSWRGGGVLLSSEGILIVSFSLNILISELGLKLWKVA